LAPPYIQQKHQQYSNPNRFPPPPQWQRQQQQHPVPENSQGWKIRRDRGDKHTQKTSKLFTLNTTKSINKITIIWGYIVEITCPGHPLRKKYFLEA
jgi:hypothetical protein